MTPDVETQFALLDAVKIAVFVLEVSPDGMPRYVKVNKEWVRVTEIPSEFAVGKTALEIFGGANGQRGLELHIAAVKSQKESVHEVTIPFMNRVADVRTTLRPVLDKAGKLTHLVGSTEDITSTRERDQALELSRIARLRAEEANRAKERFLANMSHEIRTPMNGILGMCELLKETQLDAQQRLFADTIHTSADALLSIVNDVLDFSKIQADKITLQYDPFSLRDVVTECCTLLGLHSDAKKVGMEVDYAPEVPSNFVGDSSRIRQILINLLGNAVKFTKAGTISVRVTYRAEKGTGADTDTDTAKDSGKDSGTLPLRICVADTGVGIDAADLRTIFSAFEQVASPKGAREEGTGLGLAITKALVERMGGTISVDSVVGEGTRFEVSLDMAPTEEAAVDVAPEPEAERVPHRPDLKVITTSEISQPTPPVAQNLSGLRILVAEDNMTNQMVVRKMLEPTGAEMRFVSDGQQAIDAYKHQRCDVILMDLSMPNMGGLDATRAIRLFEREGDVAGCKIIALTANAQPSDADACFAAGMNDFLSKPFRKHELVSRLAQ